MLSSSAHGVTSPYQANNPEGEVPLYPLLPPIRAPHCFQQHVWSCPSSTPLHPSSYIFSCNMFSVVRNMTCAKCAGVRVLATLLGEQNRITRSQPWFNGGFGAEEAPSFVPSPPSPLLLALLPSSFCRSEIKHVNATCSCVFPREFRVVLKCLHESYWKVAVFTHA